MSLIGSLGFNPNRRYRVGNLPGTVNVTSIARPRVPTQRNMRSVKRDIVDAGTRQRPTPLPSTPAETVLTGNINTDVPEKVASQEGDVHWMYATVGPQPLTAVDDASKVVCETGARVLVLYPMVADTETGVVSMKVKVVDRETGQLDMHWVNIYDPNTDTRLVSQFSLVP